MNQMKEVPAKELVLWPPLEDEYRLIAMQGTSPMDIYWRPVNGTRVIRYKHEYIDSKRGDIRVLTSGADNRTFDPSDTVTIIDVRTA